MRSFNLACGLPRNQPRKIDKHVRAAYTCASRRERPVAEACVPLPERAGISMPLDSLQLAVVLVILGVTHWLGTLAAFGSTLLCLPALIWFVDVGVARTVLLLIGTVQAYQVVGATYRSVQWRHLGTMLVFASFGIPIGILAVNVLPEGPVLTLLAVSLLASGLSSLNGRTPGQSAPWPRWALSSLLVIGGIIHGAFVSGGALIVLYVRHSVPKKDAFRGTLCMFWVVVNTVLIGQRLLHGAVGTPERWLIAAGLPVVVLATWLGNRTARRMSQASFARLVAYLLIVAGLVTLGKVVLR